MLTPYELAYLAGVVCVHVVVGTLLSFSDTVKYGAYMLSTTSFLVTLLRNYLLVPFMFLPVIYLNKAPQQRMQIDEMRNNFQRKHPLTCQYVYVHTKDGVNIDAVVYTNPKHVDTPYADRKWLVWMNPNGGTYEEFLDFFESYAEAVGVSVMSYNYRGVVRSGGMPNTAEDLVTDGEAVMKYLMDKGVKSENILIHGHSMGGGVGVVVRSRYPDGPVINDRSFRSLDHTIKALIVQEKALGGLVGGLMGFTGGFLVGGTLAHGYGSAFMYGITCAAASAFVGNKFTESLFPMLSVFVRVLGWEFDISRPWDKINGFKVIIYHEHDGVIHYEKASLHGAVAKVKETPAKSDVINTRYVKLSYVHHDRMRTPIDQSHQVYHVYPLDHVRAEWELVVVEAKRALRIED